MSSASGFQLASWLYSLNDEQLAAVLDAHEIGFTKRITDFYDLAAELLSERVREAQLAKLDRYQLAVLAELAEHPDTSVEQLRTHLQQRFTLSPERAAETVASIQMPLISNDGQLWPEHHARIRELWHRSEASPDTESASSPAASASGTAGQVHGYEYLHALSDLLHLIRVEPVKVKANGEPSESEFTRLGALMPPVMRTLLRPTLNTVANTKLMRREPGSLHTAAEADEFLQQSTAEQWLRLARFWVTLLPPALQHELLGLANQTDVDHHFRSIVEWLYPVNANAVLAADIETMHELGRVLGLLGESEHTIVSPALRELLVEALTGGAIGPAVEAVQQSFPADSSGLYLQTDLTAIAAGPIPNEIDFLLREFASKEGLGIAPRYRFSTESLNRAWRRGRTPDELQRSLDSVSIAELPSSLRYLIDDSYRTFTSTLVEPLELGLGDFGTRVRSTDEVRLAEIFVDPRLARFRWHRTPEGLNSQADSQLVSEMLWEAGYPSRFLLQSAAHQQDVVLSQASRGAEASSPNSQQRREQIAQLRAGGQTPNASSWALKQLSSRIGTKEPLLFTVDLPQGIVQLEMVPLGIAAGRLRARDVVAESERTLPLSRVLSIEALPVPEE